MESERHYGLAEAQRQSAWETDGVRISHAAMREGMTVEDWLEAHQDKALSPAEHAIVYAILVACCTLLATLGIVVYQHLTR